MKAVPIDQRKSIEPIKQNQSERPNLSSLIDNHKNVPAADHIPIAALPIPVAVPVRVPVGVIPMLLVCTTLVLVVRTAARKIKRYFINDAKSFGSCSLHPYSFRWVTVALSYGGCLGPRLTQFTSGT